MPEQMDADLVRKRLREAAEAQLGESAYVSVAAYTGPPGLKVTLYEMQREGDGGAGESRYVEYPYRIVNQGGDAPRAEISWAKGAEVTPTFRPLSDYSKTVDGARLALKFEGAVSEEGGRRRIKGYASVFGNTDRDGETMMPGAFDASLDDFRATGTMLYNHGLDPRMGKSRIGTWTLVRPDAHGLWVEGEIASGDPDADRVWKLAEQGHLNALSVGGRKYTLDSGAIARWDLAEISVVSVPPSNPLATFEVAKALALTPGALQLAVEHGRKMMEADMPTETPDAPAPPTAPETAPATVTLGEESVAALGAAIGKAMIEAEAAKTAAASQAEAEKTAAEKRDAEVAAKAIEEYEAKIAERAVKLGLKLPTLSELTAADAPRVAVLSRYDALEVPDLCAGAMALKACGQPVSDAMLRATALKASRLYAGGDPERPHLKSLGEYTHKAWIEDGRAGGAGAGEVRAPWAMKADELMEHDLAGFGQEWVPTLWTSMQWERIRLENAVLAFIAGAGNVIDMPSDPYVIPLEAADPEIRRAPAATNATDFTFPGPAGISRAGTANLTMRTGKLMAVIPYTAELDEDSILPLLPNLRRQTEEAMEDAVESLIINGDTTTAANSNINDIAGTPDDKDHFLVADGLRHLGLVTTPSDSLNVGAITTKRIRDMRALMGANGRMGLRTRDLMLIAESSASYSMLDLDEVVTVDKFGPGATVRTGGLNAIDGIRIHASEHLGKANAAGKVDKDTPANNTKSQILLFNRRQFRVGYRRRMMMERERVPFADGAYLVASQRVTVQARDTEGVAVGYNVEV